MLVTCCCILCLYYYVVMAIYAISVICFIHTYISYKSLGILSSYELESDDISNTIILASLLRPTSSRSGNFKSKQLLIYS